MLTSECKKSNGYKERCYSSSTINHSASDSPPSPAEIVSHPSSPLRLPPHSRSRFPTWSEHPYDRQDLWPLPEPLANSRLLDVVSACPRRTHSPRSYG